jgi:YhcH/YjgK/YiaL family protein
MEPTLRRKEKKMIYDQVKKLTAYKGLCENLDAAITYLEKNDLRALPDGKHPVNEALIVQVSHYETKNPSDARFEAHRKFIDIQMVFAGRELCYALPLEGLEEAEPFNTERDVGFYKAETGAGLPLVPDVAAIFFPWDAHKPSCDFDGKKSRIHKVILKVLA